MVAVTAPATHPFEDPSLDFPVETPPSQYYAICSTPRCGSSLLARELWRSGACGAPHEYFNFFSVMLRYSARLGTNSLHDYARRVLALRTGPNGVFGFKAHLEHYLFFSALTGLSLRYQPIKHIVIEREDIVAQAVSYVLARETGEWFPGQTGRPAPDYNRRTIAEAVQELEKANLSWTQLFEKAKVTPLRIGYLELCADPPATVRRVVDFLGIDAEGAEPVENLPPAERQDNPLKAEWTARYREEVAAAPGGAAG